MEGGGGGGGDITGWARRTRRTQKRGRGCAPHRFARGTALDHVTTLITGTFRTHSTKLSHRTSIYFALAFSGDTSYLKLVQDMSFTIDASHD